MPIGVIVGFSVHKSSPAAAIWTRRLLPQARHAALLERETGLQRWAIRLELESSRQAAAAKTLQQQLQKVLHGLVLMLSPLQQAALLVLACDALLQVLKLQQLVQALT